MTALDTDDLAVITGPPRPYGATGMTDLYLGEVVTVHGPSDEDGDFYVTGHESGVTDYVASSSLTPLEEIQDDPYLRGLLDPDYIHDYVYEEGSE